MAGLTSRLRRLAIKYNSLIDKQITKYILEKVSSERSRGFLTKITPIMDNLHDYRQAIIDDLLAREDKNGEPSIDEASAIELLKQLSDEELEEGMPFNEPADVADVLLEIFRS